MARLYLQVLGRVHWTTGVKKCSGSSYGVEKGGSCTTVALHNINPCEVW